MVNPTSPLDEKASAAVHAERSMSLSSKHKEDVETPTIDHARDWTPEEERKLVWKIDFRVQVLTVAYCSYGD